jgi:hypothetical protein
MVFCLMLAASALPAAARDGAEPPEASDQAVVSEVIEQPDPETREIIALMEVLKLMEMMEKIEMIKEFHLIAEEDDDEADD